MPAGLTETDTMFSVREKPWHGLGTVLKSPPKTVEEALKKSGLGWQVSSRALVAAGATAKAAPIDVPNWVANVRSDNNEVLGVVGAGYTVVQNAEAFHFLNDLLGEQVVYETAGSLWGGKRVWVLARLPETQEIGGDLVDEYLYVANSHDGSLAVTMATTPVRIVCQNTLRFALDRSEKAPQSTFKFHHVGDLQSKLGEAQQALGVALNYASWFKAWGDKLATQKFSENQFSGVLKKWMPIDDSMGGTAITNREQAREAVMAFFKGEGADGDTRGNAPGTRWAAVNAVVEYSDWGRGHRKDRPEAQLERSLEYTATKRDGVKLVLAAR